MDCAGGLVIVPATAVIACRWATLHSVVIVELIYRNLLYIWTINAGTSRQLDNTVNVCIFCQLVSKACDGWRNIVMLNLIQLNLRANGLKVTDQCRFLGFSTGAGKLRNHNSCQDTQNDHHNQNLHQCKTTFSSHFLPL
ncbi:hypothetical protein ES703_102996 [subsurface metagenome]